VTPNPTSTRERSGDAVACCTTTPRDDARAWFSFIPTPRATVRSALPKGTTPNAESAMVPRASPLTSTVSRSGGSK
jgi:hypothetical protein